MKIRTRLVSGFEPALFGMRNPMNSWHLIDSIEVDGIFNIGEKDLGLAQRLIKAGSEHMKFMRQIQVWADMDMPLYWWKEMDLYKFKETNSCSTMHTITRRHLTLDDFEIDDDLERVVKQEIVLKDESVVEWKPIEGYEGEYEISNDGRVRSLKRNKIGAITVDNRGYSKKALSKNGEVKQFAVHRLVAKAFIDNPEEKEEVNHIDGNKLNNTVENLEWCTRSENMKHAHENKLQHYSSYVQLCHRQKCGKFTEEDIEEVFRLRSEGLTHRQIAEKYGTSHTTIGSILNGESYKTLDISDLDAIKITLLKINNLIDLFNDTKDQRYFKRIIQMLPNSFLQMRTVNTNYAELRNIVLQRKHHKLKKDWQDTFCKWVTTLPYAKELIFCGLEDEFERLK